jgi:hypothetical protein
VVRRPESESHHSPSFNIEVRNMWSFIFTPHIPSWSGAPKQGPKNKNRGVTVTQINVFIIRLTTCFDPDRPSPSGLLKNAQLVTEYINYDASM